MLTASLCANEPLLSAAFPWHPAQAWERFAAALPQTAVGYLYVSEAHLEGSDLKTRMRDAIRQNRRWVLPGGCSGSCWLLGVSR